MRILIFSYEYPPLGGGGGVAVAALARAWARSGHTVTVVSSAAKNLPHVERDGTLDLFRVRVPFRIARATASLASLLAFPVAAVRLAQQRFSARQFDIVISAFAVPSGTAGLFIARRWQLPHVVMVMGGDVFDPSKALSPHRVPVLKQAVAAILRAAHYVVAPSTDVAQRAEQMYGLREPVLVVPLALPLPEPRPKSRPAQPVRIVTVARLVTRKCIDHLIMALAALPKGAAQLIVIGDGPERAALEQLVAELELQADVDFRGYVSEDHKLQVLRTADIFALVSEHEGFGLVYLEAASQELPIIAGTIGGHLDFLEHGATGWLVSPGNVAQLTHALAALITQPQLRRRMGVNARRAASRFDVDHIACRHIQLFQTLVSDTTEAGGVVRDINKG